MKRIYFFIFFLLALSVEAGSLRDLFSDPISQEDEILHPDQAFVYSIQSVQADQIVMEWIIEDGYYLYKDRFHFELLNDDSALKIGALKFPKGTIKDDPAFGKVETYSGNIALVLTLNNTLKSSYQATLKIAYQGCKEDAVCYPPIEKYSVIEIPPAIQPMGIAATSNQAAPGRVSLSEHDRITKDLTTQGLFSNLFIFFIFGILLSLTPCVFPMIPILSGIIIGQSRESAINKSSGFILSFAYVIAMALTYAVLGVLAGSLHLNLQAASQNVWVISGFALIFVLLALSMFGCYELQLPSGLQSRLNRMGQSKSSGSYMGAMIMGALSAIIVGPCVAPPLAGALLYISQTGDALLGGAALFAMGMGFGVPLLLMGASASRVLPKAGAWMKTIKAVFGFIMLGVAAWFLQRIIPPFYALLIWSLLFICAAVFMGAVEQAEQQNTAKRLAKGFGIAFLVYGILVMVGAVLGGQHVLKPIPVPVVSSLDHSVAEGGLSFKRIKSLQDLDNELLLAQQQGRYVMLDFYADWCVACHELEENTFNQPEVKQALEQVIVLQADVTENDEVDRALLKAFKIFGPPAILFFDSQSNELTRFRLIGFIKAAAFIEHMGSVLNS